MRTALYRVKVGYRRHQVQKSEAFPNGWIAYQPCIKVDLINRNKRISTVALLDTGAMTCVFPTSFASQLGIKLDGLPSSPSGGYGGNNIPALYRKVSLDFGGIWRLRTLVGFSDGMEAIGYGVLGGFGFFDKFDAIFCYAKRNIVLQTHVTPRTKGYAEDLLVRD